MKRLLLASFILLGSAIGASAQKAMKKQNALDPKQHTPNAEMMAHKNAVMADAKILAAEEADLKQKEKSSSDVPAPTVKHP